MRGVAILYTSIFAWLDFWIDRPTDAHHHHHPIDRYAPGVEFPDFDFHLRLSEELRAAVARLEGAVQKQV
jgi:hypothetical protein